jgi:hypothetical protein
LGQKLAVTDLYKLAPIILEDLIGVIMTPKKNKKREALAALTIFC